MHYGDPFTKSKYVRALANIDGLENIIKNSYGNYVVQKALTLASNDDREYLSRMV